MKGIKGLTSKRQHARHPGDVLFNQFMKPLKLTASGLALALHVSRQRIGDILNGRRGITAETALRLSRFFGTTAKFWLDMQTDYDLSQAMNIWMYAIDQQIQPLALKKNNSSAKQDKSRKKARLPAVLKLTGNEKKVYKLLSESPVDFEDLLEQVDIEVGHLSAVLTTMELSGLVTRHYGNLYSKCLAED